METTKTDESVQKNKKKTRDKHSQLRETEKETISDDRQADPGSVK